MGLIQTAIRLVDDEQARVLMLTYNKALVSDIRRLFALAEIPDMFEENCLHISTLHSYFYRLVNTVLYDGKLAGDKFLDKYDSILKELLEFIQDEESVSLVKETEPPFAHRHADGRMAVVQGVDRLFAANVVTPDLRGGAALILAALAAEGESEISEIRHVERGYENLDNTLRALGADVKRAAAGG